jgi:PAS domain S-box-containing protein/putative nucleotidyltransferase with HDIG domain
MKKALIVDDHAENLYLLEVLLKGNGFDVIKAMNGAEALESAHKTPPDIIISDILMPVMDGFSLCRKWKADEQLKHIPFIFYTATYTELKDEKFATSLGADRFLLKPQEPEALIQILAEFIEKKHTVTSPKPLGEEMEFFRQHNEILFSKLEEKMSDLEIVNQKLKAKEEALQKNETFLDSIIENIPDMIFVKEAETLNFVRFNKAGEELLGQNRQDLIGKNDYDFFPKNQADFFTEKDREVLKNKQMVDIPEEPIQIRHLGERILHTKKVPIIELRGKMQYLLGISEDITERKHAEEELIVTTEKLRKSLAGTIRALSVTVETRDPYTAGHQKKVSNLARTIAREMGLSMDTIEHIRTAGAIHDIGKISVPAEILARPGKLMEIEMNIIKFHSQSGYNILKDAGLPYPVAEIILQHHERLDGSGYPQGLKDGQILLEACILAVADTVEAMASHRPYRPSLGIDNALEEIEKNKGILYDNEVANVCIRLFREKGFTFQPTAS